MKNEVSKAWKVDSLSQLGYSHLVDGNVKNYVERNYAFDLGLPLPILYGAVSSRSYSQHSTFAQGLYGNF